MFLVIGMTGQVMPASLIPRLAKDRGATIVEINPEESAYTKSITDVYLAEKATVAMERLLASLGLPLD